MTSVRAHEQVIAEHRKIFIMSIIRNINPNAIHKYRSQGGRISPGSPSYRYPLTVEIKNTELIFFFSHRLK